MKKVTLSRNYEERLVRKKSYEEKEFQADLNGVSKLILPVHLTINLQMSETQY